MSNTDKKEEILSELKSKHLSRLSFFKDIWQEGFENKRFFKGQNWTTAEKQQHTDDYRIAYNIPLLAVKVNRILSEQRNNRFSWKPFARKPSEELVAETGGMLMRYAEDLNDFIWTESDIYQDCIVKKYGVLHVGVDTTKNPLGDATLERVPFNEVMWGKCKQYDLTDSQWFERFKYLSEEEIGLLFNLGEEGIKKLNLSETTVAEETKDPENKDDQNTEDEIWFTKEKQRRYKVVWHYERNVQKLYVCVSKNPEIPTQVLKDKKLADSLVAQDPTMKVIPKSVSGYRLTIFTENAIVREEDVDDYPYAVLFAMFDDGEFWSLIDLAKNTQRFFDRYMSMVDKIMGKNIKGNNYEVFPDRLHPSETKDLQKLMSRLSKGGQAVRVRMENAIRSLNTHTNIQMEMGLIEKAQSLLEDLLGGRTFQGLESTKRQTATESKILDTTAKVGVMLYLDNLARWKKRAGELLWKTIGQVYTPDRQIRIMGEAISPEIKGVLEQEGIFSPSNINPMKYGFLNLERLEKPFGEVKVDIFIDKVELSVSVKREKFASILALNEIFVKAGYTPLPAEMLLKYIDLDISDKQMIINWQQQQQQIAQEQAEKQERRANVDTAMNMLKEIGNNGNQPVMDLNPTGVEGERAYTRE